MNSNEIRAAIINNSNERSWALSAYQDGPRANCWAYVVGSLLASGLGLDAAYDAADLVLKQFDARFMPEPAETSRVA